MNEDAYKIDFAGERITPDSPFHDLIQEAYLTFKSPKPADSCIVEYCNLTEKTVLEAALFSPPITEVPLGALQYWYIDLSVYPVVKETWTYMLPRLLEAVALNQDIGSSANEHFLDHFPTGDKEMWTDVQWDLLNRYQRLYLHDVMHRIGPIGYVMLDDAICMFINAGWNIHSLFDQIFAYDDHVIASKLYADWYHANTGLWIWRSQFWNDTENSYTTLSYYMSKELYDRMSKFAFSKITAEDIKHEALAVCEVIENTWD